MKGFSFKGKFAKLQQSVKANVDKVKNQIEEHQKKSSDQPTPQESSSVDATPVGTEVYEEEVDDEEEVVEGEEEKDLKKSMSKKFKNANPMKFMKNMASSSNKFVKSFGQKSMAKISESTKSIAHITSNVTTNITKPVNIFTKVEVSPKFIIPSDLVIEKKSAKQIEKQNRTKDIDAQVLQMFSEEFFNDKFDPLPDVLESLPAECDEEEFDLWVMKMTTEKNVQLQIVDENLNKCISSNQGRFVEGIETINEFDLDIHRAEISLSNSRRQLTLVHESMIVPALKIVNMKRRKMRLLFVLNKVDTIIKLFELDSQLTNLIKDKKLGEAVKIAVQLQSILDDNSLKEIELLEPLEQRVKFSMTELKDILSTGLSDIILNFNIENYEGALYSLIVLNKKGGSNGSSNDNNGILQLAEHIKDACIQLIETESRKKLIDSLVEIDSGKFNGDELEEKSFEDICKIVPYKSIVFGLIKIYEVITDIIHTHFLICQYHAKPFADESHNLRYLHELKVEEVSEDMIRDSKNNVIKINNISYNESDFLSVLKELMESKNEIWEKAEEQVSMFIRNVGIDNAKYKIEHWLALIDNSDIFCNLGFYYVGNEESYVIRNALRDKSADYFEILHKASKDILLSTLETEEWKRIPVSLQSMGGIAQLISQHRIYHRYVRDTSEDEHILTAYHETGNPFKDRNLESTPLIFYRAPSMTIDENDTSPLGRDIITSSAINGFIKCTGIYVQFMECIPIIAMEIFERLCDLFKIYVYYVYSLFKPHDELVQWLTDCRSNKITYLNLYNLLCDGYKAYFGKDMDDTFIPSPLYPEVVTNLRLQTTGSAFHFEQRGVAVESVAFLIRVIKRVGRDIVTIAPELTSEIIDDFVNEVTIAYSQLEEDIYKSSAKQLSDLDINTIPTMITSVKWNNNKMNSEQNQYMVIILKELHRIWRTIGSLIECQTLNEASVVSLWTYVIGDYCQKLLEGYSSIKKCSQEGRSNMSMDFAGFETLLSETHKLNGVGGISLAPVRNYINAYYMEIQEIINFAKTNTKDYTYEQILALGNCISRFGRKDMNQLTEALKAIYNKN